MSETLQGRRIVVTGASSGLGAAIVRTAAAAGASVGAIARRGDLLAQLAAEAGVESRVCDIADEVATESATADLATALGGIDALINCAGVMLHSRLSVGRRDDWRETMTVNVQGTLNATISTLPYLRESAPSDLMFISSPSADRVASPASAIYSASKAALSRIAEGLHAEFDAEGVPIRVSVVKPGYIATDGLLANIRDAEFKAQVIERGRTIALTPDDVAGEVIHILSLPPELRVAELSVSRTPGLRPETSP
jgi:NADP-dependent 3-hydroxy acid dehydrogenase YdfG